MNDEITDKIGIVVIGRNEGKHLNRCLNSVLDQFRTVVYVDSGSTDDSVSIAQSLDVSVVEIESGSRYTAAKARNVGISYLRNMNHNIKFVQVLDGDCELADGWLEVALMHMEANVRVAVVCGRRLERNPDASIYNQLCDMEWNTMIGETEACGGDALIRLESFNEVGGYNAYMIAGEEPEMCWRMRQRGWKILRIDQEMTLHDAQITQFSQWWKRMVRSGHAYAEGMALHLHDNGRYQWREVLSIIRWSVLLPIVAISLVWFTWGLSLLLLADYAVLWYIVKSLRLHRGDSPHQANLYALFCILGKFAGLIGVTKYWLNSFLRRSSTIIEYKIPPPKEYPS